MRILLLNNQAVEMPSVGIFKHFDLLGIVMFWHSVFLLTYNHCQIPLKQLTPSRG